MELDRRKHDIDVLERVLGTSGNGDDEVHDHVVHLDVRSWLGGTTSVVRMTIARGEAPRREQKDERRD